MFLYYKPRQIPLLIAAQGTALCPQVGGGNGDGWWQGAAVPGVIGSSLPHLHQGQGTGPKAPPAEPLAGVGMATPGACRGISGGVGLSVLLAWLGGSLPQGAAVLSCEHSTGGGI